MNISKTILELLNYIYSQPGISMSELQKKTNLPFSTLYTILVKLQENGLVEIIEEKTGNSIKNRKKRLYPSKVICKDTMVIIPQLYEFNGGTKIAGLAVLSCPFYKECPYKNKETLVPGKCKLYDQLTNEEKERILDILAKLNALIKKSKEETKLSELK